jgi:hypothetical protein
MKVQDLKIGQVVYHRDVYEHGEALKIVGIREYEVELEGDFSGGTHGSVERCWLPAKGISRIYNHAYKLKCRQQAEAIQALAIPITDRNQDNMTKTMFDLNHMVMILTNDVSMNPEID